MEPEEHTSIYDHDTAGEHIRHRAAIVTAP